MPIWSFLLQPDAELDTGFSSRRLVQASSCVEYSPELNLGSLVPFVLGVASELAFSLPRTSTVVLPPTFLKLSVFAVMPKFPLVFVAAFVEVRLSMAILLLSQLDSILVLVLHAGPYFHG